ncbi:L-threonine 3-dehydrogenase [Bacillus massiliglaciei]|uniref:L-threonine 3-dehydrogenase n=1 Tax=Bacillus massiliglaciei TaxID=1816693 RepID=UPI000A7AB52B|nr:L-threonine 3-dehydrogenase [Bacillus massiliglaciei]
MKEKMKALVKPFSRAGAEMKMVDIPAIKDDEVLIKVKAASICGTDVHIFSWDKWAEKRVKPPYTMGHEFTGEIVQIGRNVKNAMIGDLVTAETHIICHHCPQCLEGNHHVCRNTKILGVDRDGSFAEYVAVPSFNIWKNPAGISLAEAAILEPLGNAVHTVLSGEVTGKMVAIIGCGPIGLMAIAVAKAAGAAAVIAIDVNEHRLDLAKRLGASYEINSSKENTIDKVKKITSDCGAEVVCEMSGNPRAVEQAFEIITPGGRMSILSLPPAPIAIDFAENLVLKGITVKGISGRRIFSTWRKLTGMLSSGILDIKPLVTHTLPLEEYKQGFEMMSNGQCGKVLLLP